MLKHKTNNLKNLIDYKLELDIYLGLQKTIN